MLTMAARKGLAMMLKDDAEHPIPETWRTPLRQIADAFAAGDYELRGVSIAGLERIPSETAESIKATISAYGDALAPLNDATWERSVCRWMDGHWQVLVDLTTASEPVSDLTLHAKMHEGKGYRLEVDSVHVP